MSSSIAAAGLQGCPDPRIEKDLLQPKKNKGKVGHKGEMQTFQTMMKKTIQMNKNMSNVP